MQVNDIYKNTIKQLVIFCIWVMMVRFFGGISLFAMTIIGVFWAFKGCLGKALSMHIMITFMCILNPHLIGKSGMLMSLGLRGGPLLIGLSLAMNELSTRCRRRLPLNMMLAFLLVAGFSSVSGWCPKVSFLKLLNFTVFFLGLWLGTKGLECNYKELATLRYLFLSLAVFLVIGSLALKPFPGISTMGAIRQMAEIGDISALNEFANEMILNGTLTLFCGVTCHSQTLSPLLVCCFAWVLYDLLFIEGRFRWLHCLILLGAIPMLYMTRSRVALLGLVVSLIFAYVYLPRKMQLVPSMKKWLGMILVIGGVLLATVVTVMEVKSNAISRWVRKTENLEGDRRSLKEAVTSSRQGLLDLSMEDFYRNPLLGMGFQVAWYTKGSVEAAKGLILSSPIEKGVLPVMVLGETGIVGAFVFALFLITFYFGCINQNLFVTISMMGILLMINMGEATYFSPGGAGGIEWMLCVVGGYVLDLSFSVRQEEKIVCYGMI